ncbi:endonuclease/exonuclease/phosphatase family protein [Streptomyces sp. NBC_00154]|uniref:endonuclease/exonuclease/phosphatase family protein n=1 Tax=Streptomyces sp. NBC_00154 TaxID=2975670 RepID=UPI0022522048|nr:endonuclease/exonuclease/phosphatase family protein [Streptomyces sp. NBC_00154]MCX5316035.1 endonuclease/exonuclease/phosphatase [Streptomyces sp. NBC_00154]
MPMKTSSRLAALTVAAVCSTVTTVVLSSPVQAGTLPLAGAHGQAESLLADQVRIHDIQGGTRTSPLAGTTVTTVPGIVTGLRTYGSSKGFWFQDPEPDNDPATSEGVFVFTSSTPKVAVGDSVQVSGSVSEYIPGGTATGNQSVTEIGKPTVTVVSSGNALPAPVTIDASSVPDAYTPDGDSSGSINALPLQPDTYALDYYESLEGMDVEIGSSRVVTATDPYAELWVTVKPDEHPDPRGGTVYGSYTSQNSGRLQVQSLIPTATQPFPTADVGQTLEGTTEGPLDFNQFGGYTLVARTIGTVTGASPEREVTRKQASDELAVATYNVENLAPSDPQTKFDKLADGVVNHLSSPDIVALEEIQDNSGATDDGTVAADQTVQKFIDAVVAAGGPHYEWRSIDPVNDADGGAPGGNIRQVFLFNPDRVSFVDRPGGGSTTADNVVGTATGRAVLTQSPGRIDPTSTAWTDSRKPLAGQFTFQGRTVFVIANHFMSKGGDQALTSAFQPPTRSSETERHEQADEVNAFVKKILAFQSNAEVLAIGDLNDFEFSDTATRLEAGGVLWSAIKSLPEAERYTYDYQGNSQVLDQILVSPAVQQGTFEYDSVHINAEFADQNSDHDPQVLRLKP